MATSKSIQKRMARWTTKDGQERTSESWYARYRDETGREHAKRFKRKVDAKKWLDEVTASIVTGNYVDPNAGKVTFRQWSKKWADSQDWTSGTSLSAATALESVTFADVPMRMITENHVRAWMKAMRLPGPKRKRGLAASTRRTRFNYVRMCFLAAVRLKVISSDPTAAITPPKVPKVESKMRIPTDEQVGAAIAQADEAFRAYVAVCAFAPTSRCARSPASGSGKRQGSSSGT